MKAILAVVQEQDAGPIVEALRKRKIDVEQIASTGRFWCRGNVTLLIGVDERRVEEAVDLLRKRCRRRRQPGAIPFAIREAFPMPAYCFEEEVGGGSVFVLNARSFENP
jgi:uncharacterized protein YaaQ